MSYRDIMNKKNEIIKDSIGIDYSKFEKDGISFDYEELMSKTGYSLEEIIKIQRDVGFGNTPLIELKNITKLARKYAPKGKGAKIFIKKLTNERTEHGQRFKLYWLLGKSIFPRESIPIF